MKMITLSTPAILLALLVTPLSSIASSSFDDAAKSATIEIDKAKAVGYEWRDSRKILKQAAKAEKAGDHATAMKLAAKAKQQGLLAVMQAEEQKNAGPH
ncbi:MAG: hypothetical protein KAJ92_05360 [Gammaproteobacteria bacterium]|nr:hypothetical protein [Gammaproteobacteria bacterium]